MQLFRPSLFLLNALGKAVMVPVVAIRPSGCVPKVERQ
jgi:hypothetical protein